jgi:hypothetical protein
VSLSTSNNHCLLVENKGYLPSLHHDPLPPNGSLPEPDVRNQSKKVFFVLVASTKSSLCETTFVLKRPGSALARAIREGCSRKFWFMSMTELYLVYKSDPVHVKDMNGLSWMVRWIWVL